MLMYRLFLKLVNSLLFLALLNTASALKASETSGVSNDLPTSKPNSLRVGVLSLEHFPSFAFTRKGDKGFAWAVLELFAKHYNYEFEYIILPATKIQRELSRGHVDLVFPDNPLWTTHKSLPDDNIYSYPILEVVGATFVDEYNSGITMEDVSSISVPFGYTPVDWLPIIEEKEIYVMPARDLESALQNVKIGKVMAADVEYNAAQHIISSNPQLSSLVLNRNLAHTSVSYYLSTEQHIILLEEFSKFILENADAIKSIREEYEIKNYEEIFGATP